VALLDAPAHLAPVGGDSRSARVERMLQIDRDMLELGPLHLVRSAKYTQAQIDAMGKKGQAFKNPDGSFSHPIADDADVKAAVAAATGNAALKAFIKARLKKSEPRTFCPAAGNEIARVVPPLGTSRT